MLDNFVNKPKSNFYWLIVFEKCFSLVKILSTSAWNIILLNFDLLLIFPLAISYAFAEVWKERYMFLLLTRYFGDTSFVVQKTELFCFYICRHLSILPNDSVKISPISSKFKFYLMGNVFWNTGFYIFVTVPLSRPATCKATHIQCFGTRN